MSSLNKVHFQKVISFQLLIDRIYICTYPFFFNLLSISITALTMVSDASAYAVAKNCGSLNSLIAGILSIGRTLGSWSIEKYDIALADARIERRRISSGIIVTWRNCYAKIGLNYTVRDFLPECATIYKRYCLFIENLLSDMKCLLFYAIISILYRNPSVLISDLTTWLVY